MRWLRRIGALLGVAATSIVAAQNVEVSHEFVLEAYSWPSPTAPLELTLTNPGPSRKATITVTSGQYQVNYPIDLPTGEARELTIWYPTQSYDPVITLTAPGHFQQIEIDPIASSYDLAILAISDVTGEVSSFSGKNFQEPQDEYDYDNPLFQAGTWKPEDAPERSIGYPARSVVFLFEGSERLNDKQVEALQGAVLMGTTIIVNGGPAAAVLADPRWEGWIASTSGPLENRDFKFEDLSYTDVTVRPLRDWNGVAGNSQVQRRIGRGQIVTLGYNPFTPELREGNVPEKLVRQYYTDTQQGEHFQMADRLEGTELTPPNPARILLPLGIFVLLVGPVQFLVLRAINRVQLAWVTAPVLSLVFAGIMFAQVRLPDTGTSQASYYATVAGDADLGEAVAIGRFEMFFPEGGRRTVPTEGIEAIWTDRPFDGSFFSQASAQPIFGGQARDTGNIELNDVNVNPMSYYQFTARFDWEQKEFVRAEATADGKIKVINPLDERLVYANAFGPDEKFLFNLRDGMDANSEVIVEKGESQLRPGDVILLTYNVEGLPTPAFELPQSQIATLSFMVTQRWGGNP